MTTQGPVTGLTAEEVERRRTAGQTNQPPHSATKTVGEIVRDNVCTYFNLVFLLLAMALAMVGSYANMTFLGVVVCNTVIGIVQQLRSKKAVDELKKLYDIRKAYQRDELLKALESSRRSYDEILAFITSSAEEKS